MITDEELSEAVTRFWGARSGGTQSATHDKAFLALLARELADEGWPAHIATHARDRGTLVPGFFRSAKSWDIVCRDSAGLPRICIEFKSQVGSYGNNENNRYEEALGSGLDARALHGKRIALGFFLVLCDEDLTRRKTRSRGEGLDRVFDDTSHADRRAIFGQRIVEFRLNGSPFYDAAAILFVRRDATFISAPDPDLDVKTFVQRLVRSAVQ